MPSSIPTELNHVPPVAAVSAGADAVAGGGAVEVSVEAGAEEVSAGGGGGTAGGAVEVSVGGDVADVDELSVCYGTEVSVAGTVIGGDVPAVVASTLVDAVSGGGFSGELLVPEEMSGGELEGVDGGITGGGGGVAS